MKKLTEEFYEELLALTVKRNKGIHTKLLNLEDMEEKEEYIDTLALARETKTQHKKDQIREAILKIFQETSKQPTKYQVHKVTGIAYVTLGKYYDEIIGEIYN